MANNFPRWIVAQRMFGALMLAVLLAIPAAAAEPQVRIGLYQGLFRDIPPRTIEALAVPMKSVLEQTVGLTGTAELVDDAEKLAKALEEKQVNIGVMTGFHYSWLKDRHPDLEPILIAKPHSDQLQACVIVPVSSKAMSLKDLGTEGVIVPKGMKPHCPVFLDAERRAQGLPETAAPTVYKPKLVLEDALLELINGDHAAAVVDLGVLNAYLKVVPGNARGIRIIATSESFPFGVIVAHKTHLDAATRTKLTHGLKNAKNIAIGQPLMMMWNLKAFEDVPADYNEQTAALCKNYPEPKNLVSLPKSKSPLEAVPTARDK
jgi:ABC-type phosphate/phosphonate transport system substrate-binding protein